MLQVFARYFYALGADMERRRGQIGEWAEAEQKRAESAPYVGQQYFAPWFQPFIKSELEFAARAGEHLPLPLTMKKLKRVRDLVEFLDDAETAQPPERLKQAFEELHERFQDELETHQFLFVPPHLVSYYVTPQAFGELVADKFPSAANDIDEAGKCIALGRATAGVLHLMRVLEVGLMSLATAVRAPTDRPGWEKVINSIRGKINDMNEQSHGGEWRRLKDVYSEAAAHLLVAKDAWRNHAMHKPVHYSEDRARDIFASVRGFMQSIAPELGEQP